MIRAFYERAAEKRRKKGIFIGASRIMTVRIMTVRLTAPVVICWGYVRGA